MSKTTKRTGGVKTRKGKAITRFNSLKHGLRSERVLPTESKDYKKFFKAMMVDLAPVGYLEEQLGERIILTMWRLRRIEAYEASQLEQRQNNAIEKRLYGSGFNSLLEAFSHHSSPLDPPVDSLTLRETVTAIEKETHCHAYLMLENPEDHSYYMQDKLTNAKALRKLPAQATIQDLHALPEDAAWHLCSNLIKGMQQYFEKPEFWAKDNSLHEEQLLTMMLGREPSEAELAYWQDDDWEADASELPGLYQAFSQYHNNDVTVRVHHTAEKLEHEAMNMQALLDRYASFVHHAADEGLMLAQPDLEKVQRYEAHLERVLYRTLHELEARQSKRLGQGAPLARVEVHRDELTM